MKRKLSLLFLALVGWSWLAMAQSSVTGKIVDEKSGASIPFVNVGLFRTADSVFVCGAASNEKGAFVLQGVPSDSLELRISAIGYATYVQSLVVDGSRDLGTLRLCEGTTTLDEVTVVEKRPLFAVEGEKTMYNSAEDPSIQTGTASDALQNAPGVSVDVEGNITLRGTSSVEVWINDKPSHMSEENLKTYIQTMPANAIDRIEVITNPSARYGSDADGIINIVTTAKIQRNEFVSFGVNGATVPSVSPWASYVYSNEKLTLNAYLGGSFSSLTSLYRNDRTLLDGHQTPLSYEYDSTDQRQKSSNVFAFLSLDYQFDTANSLNLWANVGPGIQNQDFFSLIERQQFVDDEGHQLPTPERTLFTSSLRTNYFNVWGMGGLYYQHKFDNKGHNLSVSANAMAWTYNSPDCPIVRHFVLPDEHKRVINCSMGMSSFGGEAEILYNRPYSENGELTVGWNSQYSPQRLRMDYDTLADQVNNLFVNDIFRSYTTHSFSFANEAFIVVQHKWGGFAVKPGIRFCDEWLKGDAETMMDSLDYGFARHYFSLRPSLHLSYRTKSMHNFSASYTRRIASPEATQLSSFRAYQEDDFTTGNPNLERIYTNSVELGWTKYWEKFGSLGLSAYYKDHNNEIGDISLSEYNPLYGRVVPYTMPFNVGHSNVKGVNMNMMYRPTGFFNVRFNADVFESSYQFDFENQAYNDNSWAYAFRVNVWAKLWNRLELTASGYYNSPANEVFATNHARYGINCGARADFFNRKLSVFVNAHDLLNSSSWGIDNYSPYVYSSSSSKFMMRSVMVGLTFRFGKMELEQRAKQGATDNVGQGGMGM